MKLTIVLLAVTLTTLATENASAGREQMIYNVADSIPPNAQGLPPDRVAGVILGAATEQGWTAHQVSPGQVEATFSRKQHVAVVDITFDKTRWRITYKTSQNLNAQGNDIHPTYNRWVHNLETNINIRLANATR